MPASRRGGKKELEDHDRWGANEGRGGTQKTSHKGKHWGEPRCKRILNFPLAKKESRVVTCRKNQKRAGAGTASRANRTIQDRNPFHAAPCRVVAPAKVSG